MYIRTETGWEPAGIPAVGSITKADIGLGNVDNTSDVDKPVSTATQTAIDAIAIPIELPPTDGSVTDAKIASNAAIALSKLAVGNVQGFVGNTATTLSIRWYATESAVPTTRDPNTLYLWGS